MTPRLDWHHRDAATIPKLHVGDEVIPDQHPPACARWTVIETDGAMALIEATTACTPSRIRRHARDVRIAAREVRFE